MSATFRIIAQYHQQQQRRGKENASTDGRCESSKSRFQPGDGPARAPRGHGGGSNGGGGGGGSGDGGGLKGMRRCRGCETDRKQSFVSGE